MQRFIYKDTRRPRSRSCSYDYRVDSVRLYDRSLVVILNYAQPGFEGPNVRHMAVTIKKPTVD